MNNPPKLPHRFFRWFCHPDLAKYIEGDLIELFEERVGQSGKRKANWLFIWDVVKLFRPSIIRPTEGIRQLNNYGMFKNYFKISIRSMARNRLFTSINVLGLAVSMSVGLLMIAFISDLRSYDNFHEKKNRIYRINSENHQSNGPIMTLASSSVKVGYKIRENFSGVEDLTIVRRGFGGDAEIAEKKIPLEGLWADESFLKVFTFPLMHGDPSTALKEPYSVVLTEKTAEKLFGKSDVLGELVRFDTLNYLVTGVMEKVPKLSHLQFEALVSFSTVELQRPDFDGDFFAWKNYYSNYNYVLLPQNGDVQTFQENLNQLCEVENAALENREIKLSLLPLDQISMGNNVVNEIAPSIPIVAVWVIMGLTFIVILSACFNYTNLSIARSLKRSREVGIRKVIGAQKGQVIGQFMTESVLISTLALVFSFLLFLLLRDQFTSIHPYIAKLVSLEISGTLVLYFVALAIFIGLMAGLFPALFFSRIKALHVLKGVSSMRLFSKVTMRKSLIVIQYVFSLVFITTTIVGYTQYKSFINYDLGFSTENILNIKLQGNKADLLVKELSGLPEVSVIAQAQIISSLGNIRNIRVKYNDPNDSSNVWQNIVDEHYLPMHDYKFLAGENFRYKSENAQENQVIVNEQLIKRFGIGNNDPQSAIGETVTMDGIKAVIIGVLKDFHYEKPQQLIKPVVIRYSSRPGNYLNLKVTTNDWPATFSSIEEIWEEVDDVHVLDAKFYDKQVEYSYSSFLMMIKIIGFLSFLAICISSMGLFGMVVFTTETKLKEISIRKVLGAGEGSLVYWLSKSFLFLLGLSACVALPATYLLFDKVILTNFAHHKGVGVLELLAGLLGVLIIAVIMIGSQTIYAARTNPAQSLRDE